ncbi:MAG: DUF3299 domain-containing protein [Gammaproteobacteria bacterium]|nr:DUF3299 domain-containing protein [Gammaproteobacteria bacterium]
MSLATLAFAGCDIAENTTLTDTDLFPLAMAEAAAFSESSSDSVMQETVQPEPLAQSAFKTIEWIDLMPKADLEALLNPPSYISEVEDGSFEDQISNQLQNALTAASDDRYQQALVSQDIVVEMNDQPVRVPGFIVPLEFNEQQRVTQFFLVPYFGACIHVPPPPPNQIIFVSYPQGLKQDSLYDPFWISGILKTSLVENEIATSAYTIQMQSYEIYTEE